MWLQVLNYYTLAIYLVTMFFSKKRLKINCSVQRQLQRKKVKLIATDWRGKHKIFLSKIRKIYSFYTIIFRSPAIHCAFSRARKTAEKGKRIGFTNAKSALDHANRNVFVKLPYVTRFKYSTSNPFNFSSFTTMKRFLLYG